MPQYVTSARGCVRVGYVLHRKGAVQRQIRQVGDIHYVNRRLL